MFLLDGVHDDAVDENQRRMGNSGAIREVFSLLLPIVESGFPADSLRALQYPPPPVPVASNALAREACIGVEQSFGWLLS